MGHMQAMEMAAHADLDTALRWHLTSNHYPPLPVALVEPAKQAIAFANEGQWDVPVALPDGISYRGREFAPVWAAVDGWHLDAFIEEVDP